MLRRISSNLRIIVDQKIKHTGIFYLNFLNTRNEPTLDLKVDGSNLDGFYEKIISKVKIDKSELKNIKNFSDVKKMIDNDRIELVQSIIFSIGELIVDFLCENELVEKTSKGLNHRLFNSSELSYLLNLFPIFRFLKKG